MHIDTEFREFLKKLEDTFKPIFEERHGRTEFRTNRGLTPDALKKIMELKPLSVAIPEEYGGRGVKVRECLAVLSAASYESLPLSLMFGINIALFLEPLGKYGADTIKADIFKNFLEKGAMGGLMITEPDYGSDALNMQTYNEKLRDKYHLKGVKHWQGLTGMADYWLIASRQKDDAGKLSRDIDFFICDVAQKDQQINCELYNNLGLHLIPYGRNYIDVMIPEEFKLQAHSSGLKMMLDILHRSRLQFPGMAIGFIKRMLDEALKHSKERIVGGKELLALDQVQFQISRIQSAFTIASAMCFRSCSKSGISNELSGDGIEANCMKALITDLMQESSQNSMQLFGANGYRVNNVSGRGTVDSRPFMIFEGSNEMLYTQIAEMMMKIMKKKKELNVARFLKGFHLSHISHLYFEKDLDFTLETNLSQRKMVNLGKVFARVISSNFVLEMGEKGFREDLISNCLETIRTKVSILIHAFKTRDNVTPIYDYVEKSLWYEF